MRNSILKRIQQIKAAAIEMPMFKVEYADGNKVTVFGADIISECVMSKESNPVTAVYYEGGQRKTANLARAAIAYAEPESIELIEIK